MLRKEAKVRCANLSEVSKDLCIMIKGVKLHELVMSNLYRIQIVMVILLKKFLGAPANLWHQDNLGTYE